MIIIIQIRIIKYVSVNFLGKHLVALLDYNVLLHLILLPDHK